MRPADTAPDVRGSIDKDAAWLHVVSPYALQADLRQRNAVRSGRIRVLVVNDQPLVCEGLSALLSSQADFMVVGQVHERSEILRELRDTTPDVLLLDALTLEPSNLDVVHGLNAGCESRVCQTIVLTAAIEKEDVVSLVRHGVRGILSRRLPIELMFKCIRAVHNGELWVGRNMMGPIVDALGSPMDPEPRPAPPAFRLTRREHEILQLVAQGDTNKGIASRLAVSVDTVKHHLTNIFDKTGASTRLELALVAVHHRLVAVA